MSEAERKARRRAVYARPENKRRHAERTAEYRARPEIKKRETERSVKYYARPEIKKRQAEYYAKPENRKRAHAKRRSRVIGVEPTEFNFTFAGQQFCCAKCKTDKPGGQGWAADHCHHTKRFRGVLCFNCNTSIGKLGDNVEGLLEAIEYIVGESLPTNLTKQILQMAGPLNPSPLIGKAASRFTDSYRVTSSQNFVGRSRRNISSAQNNSIL